MKPKKPLYKKYFGRDFTLAMIEIWWRGEVVNPKIWTDKKQPHLPYIIFENVGLVTNGFYNPEGVKWCEKIIMDRVKETGNFDFIKIPFCRELQKIKFIYEKQPILNRKDLIAFLEQCELIWPWFEAMWWVWEFRLYNKYKNILPKQYRKIMKLRDESQNFVPGAEATICKSLRKIYSSLGDLVMLLKIEEIIENNPPSRKVLNERARGYFFTNNQIFVGKNRSFMEKKFNIKFEKIVSNGNSQEFKGQSAFKGIARGAVKIIYSTRQMEKVKDGDIIVAPMTLPDILPAIKKASAIVTDEGGITCHAAIIARELNKPCIIGTKIATKVLKDGMMVEVDANKGIVRILK